MSEDYEMRDRMREFGGFTPEQIEETVQARKDLAKIDEIRDRARQADYDEDDIDAAIAAVVERGLELPRHAGQLLFTHADWCAVQEELIQRLLRRERNDPALAELVDAYRESLRTKHLGDHPAAQSAADQRIRAAVKQAIHTGARLRDIAAAAGVTIDDIRAIRDESLN